MDVKARSEERERCAKGPDEMHIHIGEELRTTNRGETTHPYPPEPVVLDPAAAVLVVPALVPGCVDTKPVLVAGPFPLLPPAPLLLPLNPELPYPLLPTHFDLVRTSPKHAVAPLLLFSEFHRLRLVEVARRGFGMCSL